MKHTEKREEDRKIVLNTVNEIEKILVSMIFEVDKEKSLSRMSARFFSVMLVLNLNFYAFLKEADYKINDEDVRFGTLLDMFKESHQEILINNDKTL